jgi:hypothetical protein
MRRPDSQPTPVQRDLLMPHVVAAEERGVHVPYVSLLRQSPFEGLDKTDLRRWVRNMQTSYRDQRRRAQVSRRRQEERQRQAQERREANEREMRRLEEEKRRKIEEEARQKAEEEFSSQQQQVVDEAVRQKEAEMKAEQERLVQKMREEVVKENQDRCELEKQLEELRTNFASAEGTYNMEEIEILRKQIATYAEVVRSKQNSITELQLQLEETERQNRYFLSELHQVSTKEKQHLQSRLILMTHAVEATKESAEAIRQQRDEALLRIQKQHEEVERLRIEREQEKIQNAEKMRLADAYTTGPIVEQAIKALVQRVHRLTKAEVKEMKMSNCRDIVKIELQRVLSVLGMASAVGRIDEDFEHLAKEWWSTRNQLSHGPDNEGVNWTRYAEAKKLLMGTVELIHWVLDNQVGEFDYHRLLRDIRAAANDNRGNLEPRLL